MLFTHIKNWEILTLTIRLFIHPDNSTVQLTQDTWSQDNMLPTKPRFVSSDLAEHKYPEHKSSGRYFKLWGFQPKSMGFSEKKISSLRTNYYSHVHK